MQELPKEEHSIKYDDNDDDNNEQILGAIPTP